jgi:hypothetical protein
MKPSPAHPSTLVETRINQEAIGARLREMFEEVVSEPIPDEFLEILRRADESPPAKDSDADPSR